MITATIEATAERTGEVLADLTTYPEWLPIVSAVTANDDGSWFVTLRARLGPFARSKRLRMVRADADTANSTNSETNVSETNIGETNIGETNTVRFVRAETDGRDHAAWVLAANVEPVDGTTCHATVELHYGGTLWSAPLEGALASAEDEAIDRLSEYLRG